MKSVLAITLTMVLVGCDTVTAPASVWSPIPSSENPPPRRSPRGHPTQEKSAGESVNEKLDKVDDLVKWMDKRIEQKQQDDPK